MIVCSCNVLSDQEIAGRVRLLGDQCRVSDIYESLGCRPQCGRCARTIAMLIDMHSQTSLEVASSVAEPRHAGFLEKSGI